MNLEVHLHKFKKQKVKIMTKTINNNLITNSNIL